MRSGELRHVVMLQAPAYRTNSAGDSVIWRWEDVSVLRASVRHLTSNEADRFARLQTVVTHNVTLRYLPGINDTMRLKWGDKILSIAEIGLDPTAKRMMYLKCTELKPDTASDDPGSASASASGSMSDPSDKSDPSDNGEYDHA